MTAVAVNPGPGVPTPGELSLPPDDWYDVWDPDVHDEPPPMSRVDAREWEEWAGVEQDEAERFMLRLKAPAWVFLPPGAELAAALEELRPQCESPIALLEAMKAAVRMESWAAAIKNAAMASFIRQRKAQATEIPRPTQLDSSGRPIDPERSWAAEIAAALHLAPSTAARHIDTALHLTGTLTATHTALRCGALTFSKALAISEATRPLSDDAAHAVEAHVLRRAPGQTHKNLNASLRRQVAKHTSREDTDNHRAAIADRTCKIVPLNDGMAGLWVVHTADKIQQMWIVIQAMADLAKRPAPPEAPQQTPPTPPTNPATTAPKATPRNAPNPARTNPNSIISSPAFEPNPQHPEQGQRPPEPNGRPQPSTSTPTTPTARADGPPSSPTKPQPPTTSTASPPKAHPTEHTRLTSHTDPCERASSTAHITPTGHTDAGEHTTATSSATSAEHASSTEHISPTRHAGSGEHASSREHAGSTEHISPTAHAGSGEHASSYEHAGSYEHAEQFGAADVAGTTEPTEPIGSAQDGRLAPQRRADAVADLFAHMLHNGLDWLDRRLPDQHRRRPHIEVLTPITTLLGMDDAPCELTGYGPIPAEMARRIATDGTWRRILTDPTNGVVLEASTTRHDPGTLVTETLLSRHPVCAWPGCNRTSRECDLDHATPFAQSGRTSLTGLVPYCEYHHVIKDTPAWGWHATAHPDGSVTLTTPTGHRYTTVPPARGPIAHLPTLTDDPARTHPPASPQKQRPQSPDGPRPSGQQTAGPQLRLSRPLALASPNQGPSPQSVLGPPPF